MTLNATRYLGIDLGSTTVKYALLDASGKVLAKNYVRHQSAVAETLVHELQSLSALLTALPYNADLGNLDCKVASNCTAESLTAHSDLVTSHDVTVDSPYVSYNLDNTSTTSNLSCKKEPSSVQSGFANNSDALSAVNGCDALSSVNGRNDTSLINDCNDISSVNGCSTLPPASSSDSLSSLDLNTTHIKVSFTGSAALELSKAIHANFVQEVIAASTFLKSAPEKVDAAIELGGEDGKIIFLTNGIELRMNEACAGGTGAFADQMASLLGVDTAQLNALASQATKTHPIASRCGVFAKTDVVALLNQGVPKSEIAKSVFAAICEQTISGLACGRPISGKVCFLGGPLTFLTELKQCFMHKLAAQKAEFLDLADPEYAIAIGAAEAMRQEDLNAAQTSFNEPSQINVPTSVFTLPELISALQNCTLSTRPQALPPLFADLATDSTSISSSADAQTKHLSSASDTPNNRLSTAIDAQTECFSTANDAQSERLSTTADAAYGLNETYAQFKKRHAQAHVESKPLSQAVGPLFLGIDLGSTTIKLVLLNMQQEMLASYYAPNGGAPLNFLLPKVQELLSEIPPSAHLAAICTTGYGADLAKAALNAQFTEVETLAHQKAAVAFDPDVSYVIDIGGQDMKCIQVNQSLITSIQLNEACSSGCGSFLETFAAQLNLPLQDFVQAALHASAPCDLGTRCTVFMNSKVKQAQRDNLPIGDIAAGLCLSIVRNALYKVLRIHDSSQLGEHVVVQGGTFLNDAILRAFELNIGRNVIRPNIAGLMGAFGAALLAKERCTDVNQAMSFTPEQFDLSKIKTRNFRCRGCTNHCALTMNTFLSGQKYIQGNRCDFALKNADKTKDNSLNFCSFKNQLLFARPVLLPQEMQEQQNSQSEQKTNSQSEQTLNSLSAEQIQNSHSKQQIQNLSCHTSDEPNASTLTRQEKAARAAALLKQARLKQQALRQSKSDSHTDTDVHTLSHADSNTVTRVDSHADSNTISHVASQAVAHTNSSMTQESFLPKSQGFARRGVIGIPRVLNMFEHYPFWHALFTTLQFNVCLSPQSDEKILALGSQSIPSQSLCLPAKLAHGHITYLAEHGVDRVFLPCVPRETKQSYFSENDEYFACPVVGGYPEALRLNLLAVFPKLQLFTPFLMLNTTTRIIEAVQEIDPSISTQEIKQAINAAQAAQAKFKQQLQQQALLEIQRAEREHLPLIVLAGHPYHIDPFINHGIPALLASMGTCLITEDVASQLAQHKPELEVVNQWAFHSRLYRAAQFVLEHPESELVQLVSFGCGIDAITSEQVKRIMQRHHRLYTMLKIDEGDTLGAAKIRLRSLLCASHQPAIACRTLVQDSALSTEDAALSSHQTAAQALEQTADQSSLQNADQSLEKTAIQVVPQSPMQHSIQSSAKMATVKQETNQAIQANQAITPSVSQQPTTQTLTQALANNTLEGRTLYMPQMAPVHFPILASCLESMGYKVQLLEDVTESDIEQGLKYINNDACYPAIVAIGQLLNPLIKHQIDPKHSALLLAQTCGSCRATNYTALLEWALKDLNNDTPIVTLQGSLMHDSHLHLQLGLKGLKRLIIALLYGDLLQQLYMHTKTYEVNCGQSEKLLQHYHQTLNAEFLSSHHNFKRQAQQIINDFAQIPLRQEQRPKVGVVGEILLKYHPVANNHIVDRIIAEGGEPVLGDITAFVLYCLHGNVYQAQTFGIDKLKGVFTWFIVKHFDHLRNILVKLLRASPFEKLPSFNELLSYGQRFTTLGQQAGEGWLLEAEMIDFIEHGTPNVICVQPFACLPNHITGKGLMRTIREHYPQANLCSLDFEAGTTQSNTINRLKLFMSQAKQNLIASQSAHKHVTQNAVFSSAQLAAQNSVHPSACKALQGSHPLATQAQLLQQPTPLPIQVRTEESYLPSVASNLPTAHTTTAQADVQTTQTAEQKTEQTDAKTAVQTTAQTDVQTAVQITAHTTSRISHLKEQHKSLSAHPAVEQVTEVMAGAVGVVTDAAAGAVNMAANAASRAVNQAANAVDVVTDAAANAVDAVTDVAGEAVNKAANAIDSIADAAADAAADVALQAHAAKNTAFEAAKNASSTVRHAAHAAAHAAHSGTKVKPSKTKFI